ncbi:hypothetical protein QMK33_06725 [Hymenobacter sp. H14-R3]|uniref:hypothetical protein n=1 Tax=Hymenobacter sp. H14-R3 TaxID=3046308 RepID=UPI0024B9741B|nr:hypothetical protein [Hymenobacter sp. H14-R3]MDJ0364841.1 hypothetical protein [Hymenobacter sp. H14-R3]
MAKKSTPVKKAPYDIDFGERSLLKDHRKAFFLYPVFWEETTNPLPAHIKWKRVKFSKSNHKLIPLTRGIYCFVVRPRVDLFFNTEYLFYVGKTDRTLSVRFKEYLDDQDGKGKPRIKVFEMLKQYDGYLYFYFTELRSAAEVSRVEEKLINTFVPRVNTQIPRTKVKEELKYLYEI